MEINFNTIKYGTKTIHFKLQYSQRKSLGIKVMPDKTVQVIAPIDTSIADINQKVKTKAAWILKQQLFFEAYNQSTPIRKYLNGETHLYLGRQYKLQLIKAKVDEVKIYRGILQIQAKNTNIEYIESILYNWYKKKAIKIFHEILEQGILKFKKYKINKPVLVIKKMEKRWGSCTKSGKITLNTELIKASKACIEYVIVHELCHLIHHNHTKEFYNLQNKVNPHWEKWKDKLELMFV